MKINDSQYKLLYAGFVVMFGINLVITVMNFKEQRQIRALQKQVEEEKLKRLKNIG